uniref:UDPsugar transporter putative n=1 Tax=Albugo laibachii Nc14 TaxID=890382 RepID=F0WCW6_9STRA|nr:UDPsugar transporter putative [Albugo laibachii Nc14]|eukprot:CCA19037.1 UDPsugar transporter putative [Albugo laibachii Nc14]
MKRLEEIVVIVVTAALMCGGNLCINASKKDGKISYISVTATLLIEVSKAAMCLLIFVFTKRSFRDDVSFSMKNAFLYAIPACLYTIDSNLTFLLLRLMDPATLSVLWNMKILTTALLFRIVLKKVLDSIQYAAIGLLLLGVITSESDLASMMENRSTGSDNTSNYDENHFVFGIVLVGIGIFISSCAGIFIEWALKRDPNCCFMWQNMQLYMAGIFFNLLGLLAEKDAIYQNGFFHGYTLWTYAAIMTHSIGGIAIGYLFKYLDNIACVYAHAVAMMLTVAFCIVFFNFSPSLEFLCGFCVVVISTYLYHFGVNSSEFPVCEKKNREPVDAAA